MKENKLFTELLVSQSRNVFIQKTIQADEVERQELYEGTILRVIPKHGLWFGFIERGYENENVYFDNRGYLGEVNELTPHKKVKFEMKYNNKGNYAKNVVLIE